MKEENEAGKAIEKILKAAKTVAVVGISGNPDRPSHGVASYLRDKGYHVIPINPNITEWDGMRCYARLSDVKEHVDVVCVFRKPEFAPAIVEEAAAIGADAIWMQEGVVSDEAARKAKLYDMRVVMDRCMMKEHARLGL